MALVAANFDVMLEVCRSKQDFRVIRVYNIGCSRAAIIFVMSSTQSCVYLQKCAIQNLPLNTQNISVTLIFWGNFVVYDGRDGKR